MSAKGWFSQRENAIHDRKAMIAVKQTETSTIDTDISVPLRVMARSVEVLTKKAGSASFPRNI